MAEIQEVGVLGLDSIIFDEQDERTAKTIVYVIDTMNHLVAANILNGGGLNVTEKGQKMIEGFQPTLEEIEEAMAILSNAGYIS